MYNKSGFITSSILTPGNHTIPKIIITCCLMAIICLAFVVNLSKISMAQNNTKKDSTIAHNATLPAKNNPEQSSKIEKTKAELKESVPAQSQILTKITLAPGQPLLLSPFHLARSAETDISPDEAALIERHFIFSLKHYFEKEGIPIELLQLDQISDPIATTTQDANQSKQKMQYRKPVYYNSQGKVIKETLHAEENTSPSQLDTDKRKPDKNAPALSSTTNQTIITLSGEIVSLSQLPIRTIIIKGKKRITAQAEITVQFTIYQESLDSEAFFIRNSVSGSSSINTAFGQTQEQQSALHQKALLIALENTASTLVKKLTAPKKEATPSDDRTQYQNSPGKQLKKEKVAKPIR